MRPVLLRQHSRSRRQLPADPVEPAPLSAIASACPGVRLFVDTEGRLSVGRFNRALDC
jgi:hypothetical protein